jgi:hypothetical protein
VKSIVSGILNAGVKASQAPRYQIKCALFDIIRLIVCIAQIGVICLYKAQVHSLLEMLAQDAEGSSGSSSTGVMVSS